MKRVGDMDCQRDEGRREVRMGRGRICVQVAHKLRMHRIERLLNAVT